MPEPPAAPEPDLAQPDIARVPSGFWGLLVVSCVVCIVGTLAYDAGTAKSMTCGRHEVNTWRNYPNSSECVAVDVFVAAGMLDLYDKWYKDAPSTTTTPTTVTRSEGA